MGAAGNLVTDAGLVCVPRGSLSGLRQQRYASSGSSRVVVGCFQPPALGGRGAYVAHVTGSRTPVRSNPVTHSLVCGIQSLFVVSASSWGEGEGDGRTRACVAEYSRLTQTVYLPGTVQLVACLPRGRKSWTAGTARPLLAKTLPTSRRRTKTSAHASGKLSRLGQAHGS